MVRRCVRASEGRCGYWMKAGFKGVAIGEGEGKCCR